MIIPVRRQPVVLPEHEEFDPRLEPETTNPFPWSRNFRISSRALISAVHDKQDDRSNYGCQGS